VPVAPLLDLHLARFVQRRLDADDTLDFLGRTWPITPTARESVTIVHHPERRFWVIPQTPDHQHPVWLNVLGSPSEPTQRPLSSFDPASSLVLNCYRHSRSNRRAFKSVDWGDYAPKFTPN
jgi:hypothetical protein